MKKAKVLLFLYLIASLRPCFSEENSSITFFLDNSKSELRPYIELFTADSASLERLYNIPLSKNRIKRFAAFYDQWLKEIMQLDFNRLSLEGKVDYILFENYLNRQKYQLQALQVQRQELFPLLPFLDELIELEDSRNRKEKIDPIKASDQLARIAASIENLKARLSQDFKGPRMAALKAARTIDYLKGIIKRWFDFYYGYDPLFSWWVEHPFKILTTRLDDYATFLKEKIVQLKEGEIIGTPIGREALLKDLSFEMIPYTPEELISIAEKEMKWCEQMMLQASRELGFGDNWLKALEYVKTKHVEPGSQPELVRNLAIEAIEFIEKKNLLTIPLLAKETWRMEMMSPERQLINPFFTGGEVISISFPTNTMSHEAKLMSLRGNNIHFSRATVHHELIPGHHLQQFINSRMKPYRRIFRTPFWTEGWAFYWEMLLWDLGFPRSPEDKIGMLFWRMHRCARVIFSLNFHLGKMSPSECVEFLVNKVGHERANAEAEVRRSFEGNYPPLYQLAYLIGALQFRALEKELVKSGLMNYREFHDAILRENNLPLEILRYILRKEDLKKDFKSQWKFYPF